MWGHKNLVQHFAVRVCDEQVPSHPRAKGSRLGVQVVVASAAPPGPSHDSEHQHVMILVADMTLTPPDRGHNSDPRGDRQATTMAKYLNSPRGPGRWE